ncbi:MAG: hypothetical protein IIC00_03860 [Planctomycetes bacterium]|nr:hypothetical protein [Planctomycetota bacterium]
MKHVASNASQMRGSGKTSAIRLGTPYGGCSISSAERALEFAESLPNTL